MGMYWMHLACQQFRPGFKNGENNTFELFMLAVLMLHILLHNLVLHESLLAWLWLAIICFILRLAPPVSLKSH